MGLSVPEQAMNKFRVLDTELDRDAWLFAVATIAAVASCVSLIALVS